MRVCVVVVNWNGWADTIECLESLFRAPTPGVTVLVCDNGSTDGSLERIRDWAEGRLCALPGAGSTLRRFSVPPVPKPVRRVEYDRARAEAGGDPACDAPLVLVRTDENLGFAGGNNVGLRYVLARGEHGRAWLLNNDTVVDAAALERLNAEMDRDAGLGIVGSTLVYYSDPARVQSLGGATYNPWLALPRHLGWMTPADAVPPAERVLPRMAYVTGASMLVSTEFLRTVGLLSEDYFLFFEELDWAARARGRFALGYAPGSVVYHKEGMSVGAGSRDARKSRAADYYFMRARILFTRKFRPMQLPSVYLALGVAALRRMARGEWARALMILQLCGTAGRRPRPAPRA